MKNKPLFVQYCAADFLAGTVALTPWAELAYRRICDMIYNSRGQLHDEDEVMANATKTGERWLSVKKELLDKEKIAIESGLFVVNRCSTELAKAEELMVKTSRAGKASAEARKKAKALKDNNPGSTGVDATLQHGPQHKAQHKAQHNANQPLTVKKEAKQQPRAHSREADEAAAASGNEEGLALLAAYSELEATVFAEQKRPWPHAQDATTAKRWAGEGIIAERLVAVVEPILWRRKKAGDGPPKSLAYFEQALHAKPNGQGGADADWYEAPAATPEQEDRIRAAKGLPAKYKAPPADPALDLPPFLDKRAKA